MIVATAAGTLSLVVASAKSSGHEAKAALQAHAEGQGQAALLLSFAAEKPLCEG
jgi:hypothetical protein